MAEGSQKSQGTEGALDYASAPTVGGLQSSRQAGAVTVTAFATRRRHVSNAVRLLAPTMLPILGTAGLGVMTGDRSGFALAMGPGIVAAILLPMAAFGWTSAAYILSQRPSWEASPAGLRLRSRTLSRAEDVMIGLGDIAAVFPDRIRLKNRIFARKGVRLLKSDGASIALWFGPPEECQFLAREINDGMKTSLPAFPLRPRFTNSVVWPTRDGVQVRVPVRKGWALLAGLILGMVLGGVGGVLLASGQRNLGPGRGVPGAFGGCGVCLRVDCEPVGGVVLPVKHHCDCERPIVYQRVWT